MTKKPRSEILPCYPASDNAGGRVCEMEFVPSTKDPREIYVVYEGRRIATRGRLLTGERGWLSLVAGYEVVDETRDQLAHLHQRRTGSLIAGTTSPARRRFAPFASGGGVAARSLNSLGESGFGGKPENICSLRDLPVLTPSGH
jgi:hypothetical protein